MKLHVLSDLHTEIGPYKLQVHPDQFDVLVLAGDIGTGMNGLKWIKNLNLDKPIIYLAGNHEYYGHALPHLTVKLQEETANTSVHFLENEEFIHEGVRFLGATFWTDFLLTGDPLSEYHAREQMNDFVKIRVSPAFKRIHTDDMIDIHRRSVRWLSERLLTPFDGKTVVISHHAPSAKSLRKVDFLSPAYASNLERFMSSNVPLWIHGHTHVPVDYVHDGTRVVSNPRGYHGAGFDMRPDGFNPQLIVEV